MPYVRGRCGSSASRTSSASPRAHGAIAPSRERLRRRRARPAPGRSRQVAPRPWQSGQAPYGELNENIRGVSSGTRCRSRRRPGCARTAGRRRRSASTTTRPSASVERGLDRVGQPALDARACTISRSTTISIVCLLLLVERRCRRRASRISPSMRAADEAAARAAPRSSFLNSPLRPRTIGASTLIRLVLRAASAPGRRSARRDCDGDRLAALVAVRHADAGEEQPQVVVDLGDGADGRARVARRSSSARWRSRATGPRSSRRPASPSARGTAARRPTATRRSGAGPRRRACRRRATTCPSPTRR